LSPVILSGAHPDKGFEHGQRLVNTPAANTTDTNGIEQRIVEALIRREHAVSRLYRLYAERFGGYRAFWLELAGEGVSHAKWLLRLYERTRDGSGCIDRGRLAAEPIERSAVHVEGLCEQAAAGAVPLPDALAVAVRLERETLECGYAEAFKSKVPEILQVQYCLTYSARKHLERAEALVAEVG